MSISSTVAFNKYLLDEGVWRHEIALFMTLNSRVACELEIRHGTTKFDVVIFQKPCALSKVARAEVKVVDQDGDTLFSKMSSNPLQTGTVYPMGDFSALYHPTQVTFTIWMTGTPKLRAPRPYLSYSEDLHFVDLILVCGDVEVKCNRINLAAASPVFLAMLSQDFAEAKTGRVVIDDMEPRILQRMVKWSYTRQIESATWTENPNDLVLLYSAADRYDMATLKDACFPLLNQWHVSSAADTFQLAFQHNMRDLMMTTASFIRSNFKGVKETEGK